MKGTASDYINNSTYLNSYHINDPSSQCSGRERPRYLNDAGYYPSVSYSWNDWDTVQVFNDYMSGGYNARFAGDINQTSEGCSRGIDCSGFVSRAWGLDDHYGTCSLETLSTALTATTALRQGDIMNRCNVTPRHTIIFDQRYGNGMFGYEATTFLNYDRVVRIYRLFSTIDDYIPRRYDNVCAEEIYLPLNLRHVPRQSSVEPYPAPEVEVFQNPYP
jgi:hypothetical protein